MISARQHAWLKAPRLAAFCVLVLFSASTLALGTSSKWTDLSPQRQEALKPLAGEWDKLSDLRKKKWLVVADKYPSMKPEEQMRLQARMADWAKLTPEQRNTARETYRRTKAVPPEQKKAEWQKYQSLPEAQKKQLAAAADAKKPVKEKALRRQLATRGTKPAAPAPSAPGSAAKPVAVVPPAATPPAATLPAAPPAPVAPVVQPATQPAVQPAAVTAPADAPALTPTKAP
jgi:hypothetical protein